MLAIQLLDRIEFLHSKFFLHRDLKPDNFLIGKAKKVIIRIKVQFDLFNRFRPQQKVHHKREQTHPLCRKQKSDGHCEVPNLIIRYASVNTHLGIEQSRRDDLESLGYILVYFLKSLKSFLQLLQSGFSSNFNFLQYFIYLFI